MLFCGVVATILAHTGVIVQRCTFKEEYHSKMQLSYRRSDFQDDDRSQKQLFLLMVSVAPVSLQ